MQSIPGNEAENLEVYGRFSICVKSCSKERDLVSFPSLQTPLNINSLRAPPGLGSSNPFLACLRLNAAKWQWRCRWDIYFQHPWPNIKETNVLRTARYPSSNWKEAIGHLNASLPRGDLEVNGLEKPLFWSQRAVLFLTTEMNLPLAPDDGRLGELAKSWRGMHLCSARYQICLPDHYIGQTIWRSFVFR